jgi:hypothetical protein
MIGTITAWLKANQLIAIGISVLATVTLGLWFMYSTARLIDSGGQAKGRAAAEKEIVEDVDAENKARRSVADCFAAGRVWDDARGECPKRPVPPAIR